VDSTQTGICCRSSIVASVFFRRNRERLGSAVEPFVPERLLWTRSQVRDMWSGHVRCGSNPAIAGQAVMIDASPLGEMTLNPVAGGRG
jgi:hypothetical protein